LYDKHFYSNPVHKAEVICDVPSETHALSFSGKSVFDNIIFSSTIHRTGKSPHGETYTNTSNIVLTEIWEKTGTFNNCEFINGLIAIRGRKSTNSVVIPQSIVTNNCKFTACKIPIQGYSKTTLVKDCQFYNDGDLYSGDHCVYMERYGCEWVKVVGTTVNTINTESGSAFQIYGSPKEDDIVPTLFVNNCIVNANLVTSASEANVTISNTVFHARHNAKPVATADAGSLTLKDSEFYHSYAFSYANTVIAPVAENCKFILNTSMSQSRCNFPLRSINCNYVNWGGTVRVDNTSFEGCNFSKTGAHTLGNVYVRTDGPKVAFSDTIFYSGDTVINNENLVTLWENCTII